MTMTRTNSNEILSPEQVAELLITPAIELSVAAQVSTVVTTGAPTYRVPLVQTDPTAAWVAEGQEINPSDMQFDEVIVTPSKLAGLTIITRELAEDSTPEAAQAVGDGLARDIARKMDAAFFGNLSAPAPAGLGSLTPSTVDTGATIGNTDPFAEALSLAENVSAVTTAFVTDPATALALAKVKKASGSNEPLLGNDPTAPTSRTILGVPLYVSAAVTAGTVWALPRDRVYLVLRDDTRIEVDHSVYFTSDRVAVKATLRCGFAYPHPAAIVRLYDAP